ncbi:hypothetical protein [Streptomyces sp. H27-D2]|uniref:hypothetical protein n=1 Tax=Streptomyces sp. H27-D2 TaxID=3046304 RepID=UPI002DBED965|nr:hypothetical protein [Streptomyces sp. H27-D2]MEC4017326.1 hypothetical protein [Streptomyces sp. H27-D2]
MSAISLALPLAATTAVVLGAAALCTARGVRRQLCELHAELAAARQADSTALDGATVPAARATPVAEIRAAVADALAEERERELAEARAFWAAQEARDAADAPSLLGGYAGMGDDSLLDGAPDGPAYVPRQADFAGLEPLLGTGQLDEYDEIVESFESVEALEPAEVAETEESPERAAARRRHPSHPSKANPGGGPNPNAGHPGGIPSPTVADHDRTIARLAELAEDRVPLADVRPGPLGTLDVYVFSDGTTICMTPGHRETAEQLAEALRTGPAPVLLGGSGIAGAYALTFGYGRENVYVLADRVIASM